jgi:hypothetical protein
MNESTPIPKESQEPHGWFKAWRHDDALELIRANPKAFILAYIIAYRARWNTSGFNRYGLLPGEAMIGDYANYGMTEQEYRTSKLLLEKANFATFKATNKGTIASLCDSRLFEVLSAPTNDQNNGQPTDSQRTANGRVTTNQEGEEGITKEKGKKEGIRAVARPAQIPDDQWLAELQKDAAYVQLDVQHEFAKAVRWTKEHRRKLTRNFFTGWLNRVEKPITIRAVAPEGGSNANQSW